MCRAVRCEAKQLLDAEVLGRHADSTQCGRRTAQASGSSFTSAGGSRAVEALEQHDGVTCQALCAPERTQPFARGRLEIDAADIHSRSAAMLPRIAVR